MFASQRQIDIPLDAGASDAVHSPLPQTRDEPWPLSIRLVLIMGLSIICWAPIVGLALFLV